MKKPKLTKWFDGSVKPVRDGVYQRLYEVVGETYCKFFEGDWYEGWSSIEMAAECMDKSSYKNDPWRGLAQNPEVQP